MKPKSGKAIDPVKPVAVEKALEADVADPGAVEKIKAEQAQKKSGKYGKQPVKPFKPQSPGSGKKEEDEEEKKSWIEIELVDEADAPVAGQRYEITLPDGRVAKGTLDSKGLARIDGIEPGTCQVSFPDLDKEAWEKA